MRARLTGRSSKLSVCVGQPRLEPLRAALYGVMQTTSICGTQLAREEVRSRTSQPASTRRAARRTGTRARARVCAVDPTARALACAAVEGSARAAPTPRRVAVRWPRCRRVSDFVISLDRQVLCGIRWKTKAAEIVRMLSRYLRLLVENDGFAQSSPGESFPLCAKPAFSTRRPR